MFKISGVGIVCALAFAVAGCSGEAPVGEGSDPNPKAFEFAPESTAKPAAAKPKPGDGLVGKGSATVPFGPAIMASVSIAPGQTVSYTTSQVSGAPTVDTVLALFMTFDNATFLQPGGVRVGIQTLAVQDDISWPSNPYSSLSYTNNSGQTQNAYLAVFGYGNSIGPVQLSGVGQVEVKAGSTVGSGTASAAFTNGSSSPSGGPDTWLYMFDYTPGQGNGAFNDDNPLGGTNDSRISDATSSFMWYVASAYGSSSGTTTINY